MSEKPAGPFERESVDSLQSVTVIDIQSGQSVVPYDENLLERTRTQWQFGDWQSLAELERDILQHHPDRPKLALLAAAGRLQLGHISEARQFIRLAQDWGVSKRLLGQILAAGVHNSLARAAVIAGSFPRALEHFESAIALGTPGADKKLLTKARINQQCSELGLTAMQLGGGTTAISSSQVASRGRPRFRVSRLAEVRLGAGWAGNTVNTVIFRHHGVVTSHDRQFSAFYVDAQTLRLACRNLNSAEIEFFDLEGGYNLYDAHNSISIGIDRDNHLHICYDQHATQLRYRRSLRPNDISGWSEELSMTGEAEDRITYPTFILPRNGFPLTLLYRDGGHNKGAARIKTYDEMSESWTDHPLPILSGSDSKPWTSNAYWNHPAVGSDGSLHLSFVWRTHPLGTEERINNIDVGYACSLDNGITWVTSKGRNYRLPITQINSETIYPISPGSNLINQCSMALDSRGCPHIAFYADDIDGIPQYQYLRYDGKRWHHQIVSRRISPFSLRGRDTLQIPISRPEIVLDRRDNAYIISRGDHSQGKMVATLFSAPEYKWNPDDVQVLWGEDLGHAEPIIDRIRWERDNVLSMFVQYNEQPDHDVGHRELYCPATLIDFKFEVAGLWKQHSGGINELAEEGE
ncbi:BNR repeat-containing protein [Burkholderia diffusa]|uniref:Uncharacterized protein n=1 Tax=Burkholderia diffusa TaxID=488732 RepID=A0A6P2PWK3_9BURK|nr:BNR repeat-containing protein [Burkholderia diffusa]KAB0662107.1 hypothetical protein F7R23_04075 [Burkholderia diffusa]MBM2655496.1 BNR repeat-containing protein [Burkholderia diffusa]VWC14667.1 hypothetical protein BDI24065_05523 [Burkholderia diffusa]